MIDLLLVNAPSRARVYGLLTEFAAIEPPVWAGLIARASQAAGFSVKILDAESEKLTVAQTAMRIYELQPRLAAFSVYGQQPSASTQCLPAASAVAGILLGLPQPIPTLAFGTHCSALPEKTLREEPFNFVAAGEGLQIVSLLQRWEEWRSGLCSIGGLWGLRGTGGKIIPMTFNGKLANHLDCELPDQAWNLLDMTRYRAHNWHLWTGDSAGGYASVQTSLGCPFRCSFCCINAPFGSASIRYWSPENIVRQIGDLVDRYHIKNIKIPDEMFTLNPARVKDICRHLIAPGYGKHLNLWAYARIDTVRDEEMLALMREAGFRWLGLGIESGSKHVRDGVEKGHFTEDDIHAAVARVRVAGICIGANYIFGLPDDTADSIQATLDLACELNTEWANFYCAMAYPGSALHVQVSREHPEWLPENNPCGWIGYSQHAPETLPLPTAVLTAAQVLAFRDDAFMTYFSRPEYRAMIADQFGLAAAQSVERMLSVRKPKRDLLP